MTDRERQLYQELAFAQQERDRLKVALAPFIKANRALRAAFAVQPDDHKIVQLGGVWLTWGDFRRLEEIP